MTGEVTVTVHRERASYRLPTHRPGLRGRCEEHYAIREGEPSATTAETRATWRLVARRLAHPHRDRDARHLHAETFEIEATLERVRGRAEVASRTWRSSILGNSCRCDQLNDAVRPKQSVGPA